MITKSKQQFICSQSSLNEVQHLIVNIEYKHQVTTAIVFESNGQAYAYVNNCMHMQRPLNCQQESIFDETGKLLRCSMHGFVFEPSTGECLSPVCEGEYLQSLKLLTVDGNIVFNDKHVVLLD